MDRELVDGGVGKDIMITMLTANFVMLKLDVIMEEGLN